MCSSKRHQACGFRRLDYCFSGMDVVISLFRSLVILKSLSFNCKFSESVGDTFLIECLKIVYTIR